MKVLLALVLISQVFQAESRAEIACSDSVTKLVGIWGADAEATARKGLKSGYEDFKVTTPKGVARVYHSKAGITMYPIISHTKNSKRDVTFVLNPNHKCGLAFIDFFTYDAKGNASSVRITGKDCYHFSSFSALQTQSHGDEYSHSEEDNEAVKNEIKATCLKRKPPVRISDALAQRVRDNCRNSTVIGKLSLDDQGNNNDSWQKYLNDLRNDAPEWEGR